MAGAVHLNSAHNVRNTPAGLPKARRRGGAHENAAPATRHDYLFLEDTPVLIGDQPRSCGPCERRWFSAEFQPN